MDYLERVFEEYGLKRELDNQERTFYEKILIEHPTRENLEQAAYHEMHRLFSSSTLRIEIKNAQQFNQKVGLNSFLNQVPENVLKEIIKISYEDFYNRFIVSDILLGTARYFVVKKRVGEYEELWEYLKRKRTKENKLKMLFNQSEAEDMLLLEVRDLMVEIKEKVENSNVAERFTKDLLEAVKKEIT